MKDSEKKKLSKIQIVFLVLGIIFLVLILASAGLISALLIKYHSVSYENVKPVDREESYVMPDYPEITIDTDGTWQEGEDITLEETGAETEETAAETESETVETESNVQEVTEVIYSSDQNSPAETLEAIVNTPTQQYVAPSNPNASFANSPNAVSVYGKTPIYKVEQKDKNIINILVMGTDSRDITADRGRSDTMIIVSYNKEKGTVKLVSLLRDSLVPIEGYDWNRINTAYFFGGVGLAINTVNQLYNLDIQNFIVIDFNGVKNFIDYIGGVDITLTQEEADLYSQYTGREISAGLNHMDSGLALTHMRNRTIGTDFGRTQRQRDTITAVIKQIVTQKSLFEIYDIVDYAFSLIKTNITASSMASLAVSVLSSGSNLQIESQNVPFNDSYQFAWYNGMSILSFNISEAASRLNSLLYD